MDDEPKTVLFVRGFPRWLKAAMHEEAEKNVLEGGQFRGQREIIVDALERRYRDDRRETKP